LGDSLGPAAVVILIHLPQSDDVRDLVPQSVQVFLVLVGLHLVAELLEDPPCRRHAATHRSPRLGKIALWVSRAA
jgi:hypothetical protein